MTRLLIPYGLSLALLTLLGARPGLAQGPLTPPGPPGPSMRTLLQVEPRIPVDAIHAPGNASTEFIIPSPGSYYLTGNIEVTRTTGLAIDADGVTLDLNGFEVRRAAGAEGVGIRINTSRCVVRNGIVRDFQIGINGPAASRLRLADLTITSMSSNGMVVSAQAMIENCLVENVGGIGISAGIVSHIRNCSIRTTGSHGIKATETSIIEGNILNNCAGDSILADNRCVIRHNLCDFPATSGAGIHLTSNQGENRVEHNTVMRRAVGIKIDGPDNYVSDNTVRANADNYDFAPRNFLNLLLSEIPETIDWPASVSLAGTLRYSGGTNGLVVESNDVTIDLGGHALVGGPGSEHAIVVPISRTGISVRNGTIRDWGSDGIRAFNVQQGRFEKLHSISNGWSSGFGTGIRVGNQCQVSDCTAVFNRNTGIALGSGCSVSDSVAGSNGGDGFTGDIGPILRGCSAWSNGGDGFRLFVGSSLQNCSANNNGGAGIRVDNGSTVSDSAGRNNSGAGIHASAECTVQNCAASGNSDGIVAGGQSTVRNCTAAANNHDGIEVGSNCLVIGNNCEANGFSTTDGAGIHVTGGENRLDDNRVANNDRGIRVDDNPVNRNLVIRNTARDNGGLNYVIAAGNRVGTLVIPPVSGVISGDTDPDALGVGTTDPWANFSH